MNIKSYIDKKFLILSTVFIVLYNFFFSRFLFSVIYSTAGTDFWATLFIIKTGKLGTSNVIISEIALKFADNAQIFSYFVINLFLIVSLILSFKIIDSFKIIGRNITFKYITIVFLTSTFNTVLASRSVTNIRWTLASMIYMVFIINLYKYIKLFHSNNYLIRKIFVLKRSKYKFKNIDKLISFFNLLLLIILFIGIHAFSAYYLLSLMSLIFIRLSIFFRQSLLVRGLFVSMIIISCYFMLPLITAATEYLEYEIYGITEYILITSTFILHLLYLFNFKIRNWIDNQYPWARLLLMSTSLGFIFPIKFMLTRIYVPYLVLLPLFIITFADKIIFKSKV